MGSSKRKTISQKYHFSSLAHTLILIMDITHSVLSPFSVTFFLFPKSIIDIYRLLIRMREKYTSSLKADHFTTFSL